MGILTLLETSPRDGLRATAALIRERVPVPWSSELADLLDAEANRIPHGATHYGDASIAEAPAFRLARAYLGRDA